MTRPHIPRVRPAVTADEIRPELILISRRFMLTRGLSLGGLALLTGCDLSTHSGVDAALWKMMRFNDRVLAALFSRTRLAPTYPVRAVTNPFRFNAYYQDWQLVCVGPRHRQNPLDGGQNACASAGGAGDAAYLH